MLFVFLAVTLVLDALLHTYLYVRLIRDPGWPPNVRLTLTVLLVSLALLIPAGMVMERFFPSTLSNYLAAAAFVWMGALFFTFVALLAFDALKLGGALLTYLRGISGGDVGPADPSKRALFSRAGAAAASLTAVGASGLAIKRAMGRPGVKRVEVTLKRLPKSMDGFKIVQLSDVHIGPTLQTAFLRGVVEQANALKPDLVAITGDLVDGSVADLGGFTQPLEELKSKHGTYFVTGNHEYYSGAAEWVDYLPSRGVRVLRNERVSIGEGEDSFDLGGIDDFRAKGMAPGHGPDVTKIVEGRDPSRELVLLAHQPRSIVDGVKSGAGLQLSGHTHGGQIWPFTLIVEAVEPYLAGLYQHDETTQIYVSRGTGFWGPPMRLGAPSEITEVILRAA